MGGNDQNSDRERSSSSSLLVITSGVPKKTTLARVSGAAAADDAVSQNARFAVCNLLKDHGCCFVCHSRRLVKAGGAHRVRSVVSCDTVGKTEAFDLLCQTLTANGLSADLRST